MRLFATVRTLSPENSLFSMIFHLNIHMVLRKTALIILIKTIDLSKISSNFVQKVVSLEISLNFFEKHQKVAKSTEFRLHSFCTVL